MSKSIEHRFLSRHVALKMILVTCLIWMIIPIHNIIFYDVQISLNGTVRLCSYPMGPYSTFLSFYSILINGLSMPLLMTLFGLLTLRNVKHHRNRIGDHIGTVHQQRRKKEEWSILQMLLIQVIVTVILSLPITIDLCYNGLTQYFPKSSFRIFMENYIYNSLTLLQYLNASVSLISIELNLYFDSKKSFYVYSFTSQIFRRELCKLMGYYSTKLKQRIVGYSTALLARSLPA